ncbi:PE domain-containing protein [Mycobacterium canetti]|uniref:PE domain-containing protein n=1 Tax=Mycobacterium canetti TaxID=78331 RepID=UPI00059B0B32|nr:PE domain-containing protein [Mycobacterium canetti]
MRASRRISAQFRAEMGAYASARARLGAQAATFHDQFVRALTAGAGGAGLLLGNGGARRYPVAGS